MVADGVLGDVEEKETPTKDLFHWSVHSLLEIAIRLLLDERQGLFFVPLSLARAMVKDDQLHRPNNR